MPYTPVLPPERVAKVSKTAVYAPCPPGRSGYMSVCRHVPTMYTCCRAVRVHGADPPCRLKGEQGGGGNEEGEQTGSTFLSST